jgi:hypothetical protein
MNEVDAISQALILKFLQENFPVKRLKDGRRFRRGIIIDGSFTGMFTHNTFMSPETELQRTFAFLSDIIENVFGFSKLEINMAILTYLNII